MSRWVARKLRAARDVGVALGAVTRARRAVALLPIGDLVGGRAVPASGDVAPAPGTRPLSPEDRKCGDRWGVAVDRALRWLPGDSACLVRSRALHELLIAAGRERAVVRIGVRRETGSFEAHAWVELDGTPIAEVAELRGAFAPFDGVTLR